MEEEFVVKTVSEGNTIITADINEILKAMGCASFNNQYIGSVKAVVEKSGGRITKQRLVWGEDNDPKFNESVQRSADQLLAATVKAVEGGGDPGEAVIKFVVKK